MLTKYMPPEAVSLVEIDIAEGVDYNDDSVILQGVISAEDQGGWPGINGSFKIHCFDLAAWYLLDEPIQTTPLTVLRPLPSDYDSFFGELPANSIQRLKVKLSSDHERAVLEEILEPEGPTEELMQVADELNQPVVISTDQFGDLDLDRGIDCFRGEKEWNGETIDISFRAKNDAVPEDALSIASQLFLHQDKWTKQIEEAIIGELLELKNEDWREDGETEVSASEFLERMELVAISVDDEEFEFSYDDGDLFWGHMIYARGNLRGELHVGIQG
ncbi:MAG: DUF2262 domain-containing protein [Planctomycetaceae bacterium]|nr:DUF2262 domain-containing protein [Planctomycetaceae bacterium]